MAMDPELLAAMAAGLMGSGPQQAARMLREMGRSQAVTQDEQDRRWRNMCAYEERLKQEGRALQTGADFQGLLSRYGMEVNKPLPASVAARRMNFAEFMERCGCYGYRLVEQYEAQDEPDAPAKCEFCKKRGAAMRCSTCGEHYCSPVCQRRDWRDHKPTCNAASLIEPGNKMPALMPSEKYSLVVLGKPPRTAAHAGAHAASGGGSSAASGSSSGSGGGGTSSSSDGDASRGSTAGNVSTTASHEDDGGAMVHAFSRLTTDAACPTEADQKVKQEKLGRRRTGAPIAEGKEEDDGDAALADACSIM